MFWDQTGLVLVAKRLEDGCYRWPAAGRRDAIIAGTALRAAGGTGLVPRACAPCRAAQSNAVIHTRRQSQRGEPGANRRVCGPLHAMIDHGAEE
ncbi:hypothetical protein ABTH73_19565, partial [Acinetobacter baumannii]